MTLKFNHCKWNKNLFSDSCVPVGDDSDIREPSFLKHLNPISLSEGAQLMLLCKLDPESAPLDIFWFKDHTQINPDDRVVIEVSEDWWVRLLIDEVEPSDGGLYSCVAESDSGKATTEAQVEVIGKVYTNLHIFRCTFTFLLKKK